PCGVTNAVAEKFGVLRRRRESKASLAFMSNHFGNGVMYDERIVTYVVTGALGCIGAWIVKTLVTRGDRVVMFDSQTDRHRLRAVFDDEDAAEAVPLVVGDLTDGPAVHRLLEEQGAT